MKRIMHKFFCRRILDVMSLLWWTGSFSHYDIRHEAIPFISTDPNQKICQIGDVVEAQKSSNCVSYCINRAGWMLCDLLCWHTKDKILEIFFFFFEWYFGESFLYHYFIMCLSCFFVHVKLFLNFFIFCLFGCMNF